MTPIKQLPQLQTKGTQKTPFGNPYLPAKKLTPKVPSGQAIIFGASNSTGSVDQGTYSSFTVPADVYSINAVVVAGGDGGDVGAVGYGGTLRWRNNITVYPGEVLELFAGNGGYAATSEWNAGTGSADDFGGGQGGFSYIRRSKVNTSSQLTTTINNSDFLANYILIAAPYPYGNSPIIYSTGLNTSVGGCDPTGVRSATDYVNIDGATTNFRRSTTIGSHLFGLTRGTGLNGTTGLQNVVNSACGLGSSSCPTATAVSTSRSGTGGIFGGVRIMWGDYRAFPYNAI